MTLRHSPHLIVGFTGRSISGKTTIARAVEQLLFNTHKVIPVIENFARPLKRALRELGVTPDRNRGMAQLLGQTCRDTDADFFVRLMRTRIEAHQEPAVFLLDDCRFRNEGELCDLVFKLTTHRIGTLTTLQALHVSEQAWQEVYATRTFENEVESDIGIIAVEVSRAVLAAIQSSEAA